VTSSDWHCDVEGCESSAYYHVMATLMADNPIGADERLSRWVSRFCQGHWIQRAPIVATMADRGCTTMITVKVI
jgi:hypothetical protein